MTTPYFEADGITIYHGDSREILPGLKADAIFMDPPYAIGVEYGEYNDTVENLEVLVKELLPLCLDAAPITAVTPGVGNLYRYPPPKWVLCWFESGGIGSGPWGFCTWQPILVYGADPFLKQGLGRRPDGRAFTLGSRSASEDRDGSSGHPCPKPLDVMKWILQRITTNEAVTLIDPFMGSGTTLVAARYLGRKAIGIELEERFCEIAANRMSQGLLF